MCGLTYHEISHNSSPEFVLRKRSLEHTTTIANDDDDNDNISIALYPAALAQALYNPTPNIHHTKTFLQK